VASLPLLNYLLLKYSKHVLQAINKAGFEVRVTGEAQGGGVAEA
jgi:hypothetical protein